MGLFDSFYRSGSTRRRTEISEDELIEVLADDAKPGDPPLVVSLRSVARCAAEARLLGLDDVAEELEALQDKMAARVVTPP